jgi:hypothetical protein
MPSVSPASNNRHAAACVASSGCASMPTVAIAASGLMSEQGRQELQNRVPASIDTTVQRAVTVPLTVR